ncbi:MAG: ABC transporter permease [Ruminococcaceae bacterium]|nr:ABC transporter permease [Oscillospiraceae bacterium]
MTKYLISRIIRAVVSVVIVVAVVMVMIYSFLDKQSIFANDPVFTKQKSNGKQVYMMQEWERYGYLDYVNYTDYLQELTDNGAITSEQRDVYKNLGKNAAGANDGAAEYIQKFTEFYQSQGYTVVPLKADTRANGAVKDGGQPRLYAYRDVPILNRLWNYFSGLFKVDNIHTVEEDVGERGLEFTLYDPVYGGNKFSPAIMGNGTHHKYLLYFDNQFPYIHQNLLKVKLGMSYSVNKGIDVFDTMTQSQGSFVKSTITYPSGWAEDSADDLHTATYSAGSLEKGELNQKYFVDDYTSVTTVKSGMSKMGYSFVIGILSVILAYMLAIPVGIAMALKKDKFMDKLGTFYIIFIMAVPSLGYIFLFKAIGSSVGLPAKFDMQNPTWLMYILPIVSLALPSIANLMKWLRRYMIDQMNSDYVKFARSGGLSEREIFSKHILKNAIIPIVHGIPGSMLGALTGAIITERVYVVPGVGNLLTTAINSYDNGVIVGVTLFYALLSVTSVILGDILMSMVDPRISFTAKAR